MYKFLFVLLCVGLVSALHFRGNWQQRYHGHHHSASLGYSEELLRELRDFIGLIPTAIVDGLVAEHMLIDGDFRKAISFLRSADFKRLQHQAEQLPEFIELINFVHLNDTHTDTDTDTDTATGDANGVSNRSKRHHLHHHHQQQQQEIYDVDISNRYDNNIETFVVLLPSAVDINQLPVHLRTFISFVQELLSHLPHDRFVAMINAKRQCSAIFATFYQALRSAQFKPLVEKTMKSANMASVLDTLNRHAISAQSLKTIAYEVISWGPAV